jgi:ribosomal protein S12 methylthiotransferase accessory factor YcaO
VKKLIACGVAHGIALAALLLAGVALGMHVQVKADRAVIEAAQADADQASGLESECRAVLAVAQK